MIEDAVIHFGGKTLKTRLHEHGLGPTKPDPYQPRREWRYAGYLEGSAELLTELKEIGEERVGIYCNDRLEVVLTGVKYHEVDRMYDDHYILHLEWESVLLKGMKYNINDIIVWVFAIVFFFVFAYFRSSAAAENMGVPGPEYWGWQFWRWPW